MSDDICKSCGNAEFYKKTSGPHIGEYCIKCGTWKRWVPKNWQEFIWPIGKLHKNKKLADILKSDRSYLEWAAENLKGSLQRRAKEALGLTKIEQCFEKEEPLQQTLFNTGTPDKSNINVRDMPW